MPFAPIHGFWPLALTGILMLTPRHSAADPADAARDLDHLHLLAVGQRPESNLKEFAHHFKTVSGFRYKRLTGRHLWQISYHDRVLRREEDLEAVADYIWCNPVRAGLAPDAASYAFSNAPR